MSSSRFDAVAHEAREARENSIAPFSHFKVGAALLAADGRIFRGCNVENCTLGLTICAERVALASALAAGARDFTSMSIVTQSEVPSPPCGSCRQLLWEFCGDIDIQLINLGGAERSFRLSALFPHPFDLQKEEQS